MDVSLLVWLLTCAAVIAVFFFDPASTTASEGSMVELGHAVTTKVVVACAPRGYRSWETVKFYCDRFGHRFVDDFDHFADAVLDALDDMDARERAGKTNVPAPPPLSEEA